jgi:peptidyl-dipeptidase A
MSLLVMASCKEEQIETADIHAVLDSLEHKIEWLSFRINVERWQKLTEGQSDSLEYFEDLYQYVISDRVAFESLRHGRASLSDEEEKRKADILYPILLKAQVDSDPQIQVILDSLQAVLGRPDVMLEGEWRSRFELERTVLTERNRLSREMAYRSLNTASDETMDLVGQLFRLRNQRARKLGYNGYLGMVLNETDVSIREYRALIGILDTATNAIYNQHMNELMRSVPSGEAEIWDLTEPFGEIVRRIDPYLPVDSQFDYLEIAFDGLGFDIKALPVYLANTIRPNGEPAALSLPVKPPLDQRVVLSQRHGLISMLDLTAGLADAVRGTTVNQPEPLFVREMNSLWGRGMQRIFVDVCMSPEWLQQVAFVPPSLVEAFQERRKVHEVVRVRQALLNMAFELEAYENPNRDLSRLFWDLASIYLRVPRHDEDLHPWAVHLDYAVNPATAHYPVLSRMISAQTLGYLARSQEQIVGSAQTRAFLEQNYFRFGHRFSWKDLVQRGTTEELTPRYLLQRVES